MKRIIRIFAMVVAAATILAGFLAWAQSGWWPIPSIVGTLDARVDVARGHYRELAYGLPSQGSIAYARLLKERYGIEFSFVGYCTVSKSTRDYANAYDMVSTKASRQKFGRNVFKQTFDEAEKSWNQTAAMKGKK